MILPEIPDAFQSRIRISIVARLIEGPASFVELKRVSHASDGNLGVHLRKLEQNGYIETEKTFVERKPRTTAELTRKGRREFIEYVELLKRIVDTKRRD